MERSVIIQKATTGIAYTSSGAAVIFGFSVNEIGIFVGSVCAIFTAAANFWFQWDRRRWDRRKIARARQGEQGRTSGGEGDV